MTTDETATLRDELVKLYALIAASADMASTVPGFDPRVERTQALLDVAQRYGAQILLRLEAATSPALAVI